MNHKDTRIICITCSIFREELEALQEREDLEISIRYVASMLHMSPEKLHLQLDAVVQEELKRGNKIVLLFGDCCPYTNEYDDVPDVVRVKGINCPNIFLGSEQYRSMRKEGVFFLMPEWAKRWREVFVSEFGFSTETAQDFMSEMHSRIVYLDTGTIPIPTEALHEISEYTGLSCDVMMISLDPLFTAIKQALKELVDNIVKSHVAENQVSSDFKIMTHDIIMNLLKQSDSPSRMSAYFTNQLRELTGAKTVVLVQCLHNYGLTGHRIVHVNPERLTGKIDSPAFHQIIELTHDIVQTQMWDPENGKGKVEECLKQLDVSASIVSPLVSDNVSVGFLVLLDLPDKNHIMQDVEIVKSLSSIVALIFHNSLLYEEQETIIEKRTAEIRKSEERYRTYINNAPDGVFVVDPKGKYLDVNNAACRITGFTSAELLSMSITDLICPEAMDATMDNFARLLSEGLMNAEVLCRHKNGSKLYLAIHAVKIDTGKYMGFCSDITSRKKTDEHVLKLSHAIVQSSSTIVITDSDGGIEFANPRFAELTGYSIEEAIGKNPRILKSGKTPPEAYKELWRVITSGKEWRGELCNRKKNGELYWESVSISPVKNDKGVITNFIAVKDDITKQNDYQGQISGINDLSKHLIGMGNLEGKLSYITDGIVGLFGVDFARIWLTKQGDRCNSGCVHAMAENEKDTCIQRDRCLHLVASSGRYTHIDGKMHRRVPFGCFKIGRVASGEDLKHISNDITHDQFIHDKEWARNLGLVSFACYKLVSAANDPVGVMAVFSKAHIGPDEDNLLEALADTASLLSQTAMAEKALQQSEKLKSIGTITAGISHEFNNILAIISGNVQLLEDEYKDDKVLTYALRTIMKATDDGAEISSNMLKFTKTKPDTKEFVSSDIREMIMQSIDFTKPRWKNEAQANGIGFKMDTKGLKSVPPIMCKHSEMREMLINLTSNSLDAMPGGGSIMFSTWSVDNTVFVSVSDTGDGMSENVKKNIFDPFFSTKGVEGTGLGMSMVYGIVTRHGGKIDVVSEIGKGTTFTLQFPIANEIDGPMNTFESKQEACRKNLRILVVDDEEAIRNILNQFLSRRGHDVKVVDNGADAINMIEREDFDLVLCDLAMPNVFGYDVVKALNKLIKRPKIGIVTGWGKDCVSDENIKIDFYLRKPFKQLELAKHINDLFGVDSI